MTRKFLALLVCVAACLGLFAGCREEQRGETVGGFDWLLGLGQTQETEGEDFGDLVILYTNDVHNAYEQDPDLGSLGYGALTAYRDMLEEKGDFVVLVDGGDALQGGTVGILSEGAYMVDIMNEAGVSFAVPGDHDFDWGVENLLTLADDVAEFTFISCNFIDISSGEAVFAPYVIEEFNGVQVAFLGISTPETVLTQEESALYGFCDGNDGQDLYDRVQQAIDDARSEGADYVIAVGHLGVGNTNGWSSFDVIANTTGLSAFLDGHSHTPGAGIGYYDKDDNQVAYCANGEKLTSFGQIRLDLAGGVENTVLVTDVAEQDLNMVDFLDNITRQLDTLQNSVVARSEAELVPADEDGNRLVRKQETPLGNLCADAYRAALGADAAFVNGGGIAGALPEGEVTYGDLLGVLSQDDSLCLLEVTGQQILDALELAYRAAGEAEFGGFLQVSGLRCAVDTSIPTPVQLDEDDMFTGIAGARRVRNVTIGGEAVDAGKTYTLAASAYLVKLYGGGYTMFSGCRVLLDGVALDDQVLLDYIRQDLGGVIPASLYGHTEGRIVLE